MSDERWPDDGAVEALRYATDVILKSNPKMNLMFNSLPMETMKAFMAFLDDDVLECASRLGTIASLAMALQRRMLGERAPKAKP